MATKLVIFDCDGTLVDSQHAIVAAMTDAFVSEQLIAPARETILSVVGLSLELAVSRLLPLEADNLTVERVAEIYKSSFSARRRRDEIEEPLYPGIRETILRLSQTPDIVLGIATGKSLRGLQAVLEREGLSAQFATLQTADTHPSKPDPSMLLEALSETGAHPADTIMIGDTTYDIEMAHAAGTGALGVSWGYHPVEALRQAGAHDVCKSAAHLDAAIDRLLFEKVTR